MQSNRNADTKPEVQFRKALWSSGVKGFRKNLKGLVGRPDVVFTRQKLVIFVNGCFWHGCPSCQKKTPITNALYWSTKIEQNKERDTRNEAALRELGYEVLTFWECELKGEGLAQAVAKIRATLEDRKALKSKPK